MLVTFDGMVIEVKLVAYANAFAPMLVNLEPASNIIEVNAVAFRNASSPILVTPNGMLMEVKLVASLNA